MSAFEILVMLVAAAVFMLSLAANNVRGMVWVVIIATDIALSDVYLSAGFPYPEAVMTLLDFAVCVAIWFAGSYIWERRLYILMQFSMLVSIVDLGGAIVSPGWIDRELYLLILELINYAVLILIGGVSGFAISGRIAGHTFRPWRHFWSFDSIVRGADQQNRE